MGDLKPIGSEKLEGINKLKRIMEIAMYKEPSRNDNNNNNNLSTTSYTITLADGNLYGIVYEKSGYILKKGLNESSMDYIHDMRERKYYRSYSEAMKKLNLVASELNRLYENYDGVSLLGEQPSVKKKFVLKQNKPKKSDAGNTETPSLPPPPAPETTTPPPPADLGADAATPPPPADLGASTPPPPPADLGASTPPPAELGADTGTPPPSDLGVEPEEGATEDPMAGMGEEPMPGGDEEPMSGGDEEPMPDGDKEPMPGIGGEDDDEESESAGPSSLKTIQKLTGRLSQKIRTFDKEKGLDSQDIKYVVNSILSAIDLSKLDDEDRDDILDKLEEYDEYDMGEEGDLDLSDEDLGIGNPESNDEEPMPTSPEETTIKTESKVSKVLSKYFKFDNQEKNILEEKKKKDFINKKLKKVEIINEIKNLCENSNQFMSAKFFLKENPNAKFVGKTNKENIVFINNKKQVKITPRGTII
jgi:hypothetical protein